MKETAERIATKFESVYAGLYAVHNLLVELIRLALIKEYTARSVVDAMNDVYPVTKYSVYEYLLSLVEEELKT